MKDFDLRKYLAENKLVKEEQESITIDSKVDFETPLKTMETSALEPNPEETNVILDFIGFIRDKYSNLTYKQFREFSGDILRDSLEEFEEEVDPPFMTNVAVDNYIDLVYEFVDELDLNYQEELEEIDMTISSEAVESSVKQGLNQMFERLADIVDNKKEASIQSETLGVTNYIKRLMREYAKYADMDRRDSIEGGNKFSKQGKEEARQEIERILSMK
jgi:hypothetical protein